MSVDGTWKVTMQSPAGPQKLTFELQEAGGGLTGTMSSDAAPGVTQLTDATVDGDDLAFKIALVQPMPVTLEFSATVSGDSISGNTKFGSFGEGVFDGTRA